MSFFSKIPTEFRHIIGIVLSAMLTGELVRHGYITPDQAKIIQPQITATIPLK